MSFSRSFYGESKKPTQTEVIKRFKSSNEYKIMAPEIETGHIFPALGEKNELRFYYRGARLGTYNSEGFKWHDGSVDYSEAKVKCESYKPDGERDTLARLCKRFSPYTPHKKDFILLDIEIGFPKLDAYNQIQIDLLFLDQKTMTLYFVEGKESRDTRVAVTPGKTESADQLYQRLPVRKQIEKYQTNITKRKAEIVTAYTNFGDVMNNLFSVNIPNSGLSVYPHPKLLVYGESTQNGLRCLDAIRENIKTCLVVCETIEDLSAGDIIRSESK